MDVSRYGQFYERVGTTCFTEIYWLERKPRHTSYESGLPEETRFIHHIVESHRLFTQKTKTKTSSSTIHLPIQYGSRAI